MTEPGEPVEVLSGSAYGGLSWARVRCRPRYPGDRAYDQAGELVFGPSR